MSRKSFSPSRPGRPFHILTDGSSHCPRPPPFHHWHGVRAEVRGAASPTQITRGPGPGSACRRRLTEPTGGAGRSGVEGQDQDMGAGRICRVPCALPAAGGRGADGEACDGAEAAARAGRAGVSAAPRRPAETTPRWTGRTKQGEARKTKRPDDVTGINGTRPSAPSAPSAGRHAGCRPRTGGARGGARGPAGRHAGRRCAVRCALLRADHGTYPRHAGPVGRTGTRITSRVSPPSRPERT